MSTQLSWYVRPRMCETRVLRLWQNADEFAFMPTLQVCRFFCPDTCNFSTENFSTIPSVFSGKFNVRVVRNIAKCCTVFFVIYFLLKCVMKIAIFQLRHCISRKKTFPRKKLYIVSRIELCCFLLKCLKCVWHLQKWDGDSSNRYCVENMFSKQRVILYLKSLSTYFDIRVLFNPLVMDENSAKTITPLHLAQIPAITKFYCIKHAVKNIFLEV